MKNIISNYLHEFGSRTRKNIPTVEEAKKQGLKHYSNVFGDAINHVNCRSWWYDEYENMFRCDELLEGGRDIVMEDITRESHGII